MRLQIETIVEEITEKEEKKAVRILDFFDGYDESLLVTISTDSQDMLSTELEPFQVEQIISFLKTWLKQNPVKD